MSNVSQHLVRSHALVIGGTGMLWHASMAIAKSAEVFTAVARSPESLGSFAQALGQSRGTARHYLSLNWDQPTQFLSALSSHVQRVGPPSFVLAWLHDIKLGPSVAHAVSGKSSHCQFFQVLGSEAASARGSAALLRQEVGAQDRLAYCQIVLGFVREAGVSRWLSDDEISAGVLEATTLRQPIHTVGTITPWEERP